MTTETTVSILDLVETSRNALGHIFPVTEEQSDALQSAIGFVRTGACDEHVEYTPGFLTYTQLALGAEYSFNVGTSHFTVKDYGQGRGIGVRCERR